MLKCIKKILPPSIKKTIRSLIKFVKYRYRKQKILHAIKHTNSLKIIVGAAETYSKGWYSTNEQWLDITSHEDWANIFNNKVNLSHVVAEHVFEHLTYQEAERALALIYKHLLENGLLRIAVPDGYNPNPVYIEHVKVKGIGDDAADHKQLLNVDILTGLMSAAGFRVEHIEGYTSEGKLVQKPFDTADGFIMRIAHC